MMVEITKKYLCQAIIISILILSNPTVMSVIHGDPVLWLVYIIIANLDRKI